MAQLIGGTLVCLAGCNAPPPHAGKPTIQGQSMQQMLADINQIRAFLYGDGSLVKSEEAAVDLVSWSQRMAELFPPGRATQDYVDMSPERAGGASLAMTRTAERLLVTVRMGKRPAIGDQLNKTEQEGCGSCHLSTSH